MNNISEIPLGNMISDDSLPEFVQSLKPSDQIGMLRKQLTAKGILGIDKLAQACDHLKNIQVDSGCWLYENYSTTGSHSSGLVESSAIESSRDCIIWPINHYLGLNRHPYVIRKAQAALAEFGTGCGTSAMSGGHTRLHKRLEIRLANIFNKETAILFPTGYTANVGALSGLARGASTIVLMDRECHASIIDGVKLAGCDYLPFKHNDLKDLEKKLLSKRQDYENVIVVVESVYSMSGVEAPIADIVALKKKYGFYLFVDEAHAFGIYHIGGLVSSLGLSDDVDFLMTTLSKSTASLGGVVATSNAFRTLLMTNANAYMFQAAMTPPDTAAVSAALDVIQSEPQIVDSLWQKTHYLREQLSVRGFDIGSGRSPIVPVYVRDPGILMDMSRELYERGIFTTSVTFPAVKHNEVRFRFIVNESHTFPQIDQTVETLTVIGKKHGLIG